MVFISANYITVNFLCNTIQGAVFCISDFGPMMLV